MASSHITLLDEAGFNTLDYYECSRQVNSMYASKEMPMSTSFNIMKAFFGFAIPADHDRAANVALRYAIAEAVRFFCEQGNEIDQSTLTATVLHKVQMYFINQPWETPGAHSSIHDIPNAVELIEVPTEQIQINRTQVGSTTVKPKKGLKQEAAIRIFQANHDKPNSEIIAMFMSQLDMSKQGATTYLYNMKKKFATQPSN